MHAGPKPSSPVGSEELLKQEERELELFRELQELCASRTEGNMDASQCKTLLSGTENVLRKLPECYTLYNFRREILQKLLDGADVAEGHKMLFFELKLNTTVLHEDFKCYAAFAHRHWVYEKLLESAESDADSAVRDTRLASVRGIIEREVGQCEKLLEIDERNFHAWNYRRWILALEARVNAGGEANRGERSSSVRFLTEHEMSDLAFTTMRICRNFSNYSAWHQRGLLLRQAAHFFVENDEATGKDFKEFHHLLADDVELLSQAVYCDPNDQAAWFYAPFLLKLYLEFQEQISQNGLENEAVDDLADAFVLAVVDLIAEVNDEPVFLPHSFLLLLLVDLQNPQVCSAEAGRARAVRYAEWIKERVMDREDREATTCGVQACVAWLGDYLTRADDARGGMYAALVRSAMCLK